MNYSEAIGVMSGTSLDGIDIAYCRFYPDKENTPRQYEIIHAETMIYEPRWRQKLSEAANLPALDFLLLHNEYGRHSGTLINHFLNHHRIERKNIIIGSHGHTIFHQPEKSLTFQLGSGASIAATTRLTTVSDFRVLDVASGGQGAPLAPIGDELLFGEYDYCLNLGGFSNISYRKNTQRMAFDICPVNIICNHLVKNAVGLEYDKDGLLGRSGHFNKALFNELNALKYYHQRPPKSLGAEWINQIIIPLLEKYTIPLHDKLNTLYHHIAHQIKNALSENKRNKKILITGGGAYNKFLLELIEKSVACEIVVPPDEVIQYKEAVIFALLGVLRINGQINSLASVTGAKYDTVSGSVFSI